MNVAPTFVLLAGPNGAGKTTLYEGFLKEKFPSAPFINADDHEREQLGHVVDPLERSNLAREWADAERSRYLAEGHSFISETVFSHESKIALINTARQAGFEIVLIIVCHDNIDLLVQRVLWRAAHGKHMVPAEKIRQRYQRTLKNLRAAIRLVDVAMLFDNGGSPTEIEATVPELIAVLKFGTVVERCPGVVPAWAKLILTGLPNQT